MDFGISKDLLPEACKPGHTKPPPSAGETTAVSLLMGISGMLLILVSSIWLGTELRLSWAGKEIQGKILDATRAPGAEFDAAWRAKVRIILPGGEEILLGREFPSSWRLPEDRVVTVVYLPDRPREARVQGSIRTHGHPGIVLLTGVALVAWGWRWFFVNLYLSWAPRRPGVAAGVRGSVQKPSVR